MLYKDVDLDSGWFVVLRQEPFKSRVYYNGEEVQDVTKVEILGTPHHTDVVIHLAVAKIFTDSDYTKIREEKVKEV